MTTQTEKKKRPKGKIKIDRNRCKGCGYCVSVCPQKLIEIDTIDFNTAGYFPARFLAGDCIACGQCAIICPDMAIEVLKEKDTTTHD